MSTLTLKKTHHQAARPSTSTNQTTKFDPINEFLGTKAIVQMRNGTRYQGTLMHLRSQWLQIDSCLITGAQHEALVPTVFVKVLDQVAHVHGVDGVTVEPVLQSKEQS
jgi:hypothetical protein